MKSRRRITIRTLDFGPLDRRRTPNNYYLTNWPVTIVLFACIVSIVVDRSSGDLNGSVPLQSTNLDFRRTSSFSQSQIPSCRMDAKSVSSKTYVSPYVFEGTVIKSMSDNVHRYRHHRVTFRVDKVHKGRDPQRIMAAQKQISLQFWSNITSDVTVTTSDSTTCLFRPDIFESRRRFIVFATDVKRHDDGLDDDRAILTTAANDDSVSDSDNDNDNDNDDDLWWSNRAAEVPSFFVFCEPVALNKKSSRRIQKILRRAKPPTVSGLKNITVKLNKRFKLVCRAKGRPAPTITWFKDGRPLVENTNLIIKFNRSVSQLVIKNAKEENGGQYECRATIEATGLWSNVNATVIVKNRLRSTSQSPRPTQLPKNYKKIFGDTFTGKECPVEHFCQNNSTCVFIENLGEAYCRCADGFIGRRCEHKNVFFILGEVKQMDWTYHRHILIVVVILGVLLSITILSNVIYFIFRAKWKIQKEQSKEIEKTDGDDDDDETDEKYGGGVVRRGSFDGDKGDSHDDDCDDRNAIEMKHVVTDRAKIIGHGSDCDCDFYETVSVSNADDVKVCRHGSLTMSSHLLERARPISFQSIGCRCLNHRHKSFSSI